MDFEDVKKINFHHGDTEGRSSARAKWRKNGSFTTLEHKSYIADDWGPA